MDLKDFAKTASDRLNADDLIGGPITARITGVKPGKRGSKKVPIISIEGDYQPWEPCTTMTRVLIQLWGSKPEDLIGKTVTLFRWPDALFKGEKVGGIRISGMSDIERDTSVTVRLSQSKTMQWPIKKLVINQQFMTQEVFDEKFPAVIEAITSKKMNHQQAIAQLEKTATLTTQQKNTVLEIKSS